MLKIKVLNERKIMDEVNKRLLLAAEGFQLLAREFDLLAKLFDELKGVIDVLKRDVKGLEEKDLTAEELEGLKIALKKLEDDHILKNLKRWREDPLGLAMGEDRKTGESENKNDNFNHY